MNSAASVSLQRHTVKESLRRMPARCQNFFNTGWFYAQMNHNALGFVFGFLFYLIRMRVFAFPRLTFCAALGAGQQHFTRTFGKIFIRESPKFNGGIATRRLQIYFHAGIVSLVLYHWYCSITKQDNQFFYQDFSPTFLFGL